MANVYTLHLHERYGSIVENGAVQRVRVEHSPGLSFQVFSELAHQAYHLVDYDAGDRLELHLEPGVVFVCEGLDCQYDQGP